MAPHPTPAVADVYAAGWGVALHCVACQARCCALSFTTIPTLTRGSMPLPPPAPVPQAESVFLNMPNLHFLPCAPVGSTFKNDVYIATSEPHGNIEAVITRKGKLPHSKL